MDLPHLERSPRIHPSVYVDPSARINGDVEIAEDASVWFHVSIRGDVHRITIGARSNVQDNCVLHTYHLKYPLTLGPEVVVGHGAVLHGCTVKGSSLIGMGAVLLDDCTVEGRMPRKRIGRLLTGRWFISLSSVTHRLTDRPVMKLPSPIMPKKCIGRRR